MEVTCACSGPLYVGLCDMCKSSAQIVDTLALAVTAMMSDLHLFMEFLIVFAVSSWIMKDC